MMLTIPARAIAALVILGTGIAEFVPSAAAADQVGFAHSLRLLKSGKDVPRAIRSLEAQSANGDVAAQFVLGAVHVEGKFVPQNRPLGLAYLQIALGHDMSGWPEVRERAQGMIERIQAGMSSGELRETEQRVAQLREQIDAHQGERIASALRRYTEVTPTLLDPAVRFGDEPVALLPVQPGAGEAPVQRGCGSADDAGCRELVASSPERRCGGEILPLDTAPSQAPGDGVIAPDMKLPLSARQMREQGTVLLLVHVDSSGWVCSATVAGSSGVPALDAAALDGIARARFRPGARDGVALEALVPFRITYLLDFQ